ncbi:hypothetical protein CYMTET_35531 [Cymbomonas tetramitiformis]|uniref:Uncharacterized protein n=1 Tax=Cymbomonas tetramitiformis TaxID=36881 RepID=A0AAE0F905_9CHLO|nr:hypothetical protein CYMTET_35531 [Cymbomonas tetramitiformis]
MWMPLVDVDIANGCLCVLPREHDWCWADGAHPAHMRMATRPDCDGPLGGGSACDTTEAPSRGVIAGSLPGGTQACQVPGFGQWGHEWVEPLGAPALAMGHRVVELGGTPRFGQWGTEWAELGGNLRFWQWGTEWVELSISQVLAMGIEWLSLGHLQVRFPLGGLRPLAPAKAGDVLAWAGNTVHMGTPCSTEAASRPRSSMALTFRRASAPPFCAAVLSPLARDDAIRLSLEQRLQFIAQSLLLYSQWGLPESLPL